MNVPAKSVTNHPTIIVFGVSAIGKPRAGTFKGSDVSAARKAAAKLGLSVVDLTDEAGLALAAKVPAGRIGGAGDNIIPFINKDLHGQIKTFETKGQKNGRAQTDGGLPTSPEATPRLPRSWDDIKVGDRVLAQETDPLDGWWHVSVTEVNGDLFKLRWPSSGAGPAVSKASHHARLDLPTREQGRRQRRRQARPETIGKQINLPGQLVHTYRRSDRSRQGGRPNGAMVGSQDRQNRQGPLHSAMAGLPKTAADRAVAVECRPNASGAKSGLSF